MRILNNRVTSRPELVLMADGGVGATVPATEQTQPVVDTGSGEQSGNVGTAGGFQYQHEDAYQRLLRQAASQGNFRYNPSKDAAMQAYTQAYRREGDRATANALAQAAAATGGVPSSYAVGAAQQAGAYYASQMADKAAELEQQAYERYLNERAMALQGLEALGTDREDAYNKYLTEQAAQQELAALRLGTTGFSPVEYVMATYPDGKVTDSYTWQQLLAYNTAEELAAMGITYAGA